MEEGMTLAKKMELKKGQLQGFLRMMMLIRRFEEKAAEMYMRGKIGGFLHLYIGEEAVAVGSIAALKDEDYVVTHYREHGHALAKGLSSKSVMAELFGRTTGCSKGKGGSMHLFDASKNFLGGYAIVGGMLPVVTGLALASQQQGQKRIACAYFGDGAVNQGEFHESMNLAALWKLPVLFFLENNGYGMGTAVERAASYAQTIYRLPDGYGMPSQRIDGQDVLEVFQATKEAAARIREGQGPEFIEAITYRYRGHSMADPMEYREKTEEEQWRGRDPILLFRKRLEEDAALASKEFDKLQEDVDKEVDEATQFADESPLAPLEDIYQNIYA